MMKKSHGIPLPGGQEEVRMAGLSNSEISGNHFPPFRVDIPTLIKRMDDMEPMMIYDVYSRIFKGSMPRLYENEAVNLEQYYESYLETFISRDIKDLTQVADESAFFKLYVCNCCKNCHQCKL